VADFGIRPDIALGVRGPAVMSLGDMLNVARGAQAYQQALQINPVELEKAKAERDVAVGTAQPRIKKSQVEADEATLGLQSKILSHTRSEIAELLKKKDLTFKDIEDAVVRTVELTQAPEDVKREAKVKAMADFNPNGSIQELRSSLAGALVKTTSQETQLSSRLPKPEIMDTGGTKLPVAVGNELVTGIQPGTQVGVGYELQPSPQFQQTETGLVGKFGGGVSRTIPPNQTMFTAPGSPTVGAPMVAPAGVAGAAPRVAPAAQQVAPVLPPAESPAARAVQGSFQNKGGIQISPGETVDAYRARVAELTKLPKESVEALNPGKVDSIPNMEYTNDRIIKLLEDKNLQIGPIAKAISDKTAGVGLNSQQQEIMKYLEQRIRQEGARSNQDQESQRSAFGSFGTNKDALRTIIYNDKAILASQKLFYEGVRNAQGNANRPNLGAINNFRDQFNALAGDRDLMQYIGIVGTKPFDKLSATDRNQLKLYFSNKSSDFGSLYDDLEGKRAALLKLVRGGK
jgi:hypothetical protein